MSVDNSDNLILVIFIGGIYWKITTIFSVKFPFLAHFVWYTCPCQRISLEACTMQHLLSDVTPRQDGCWEMTGPLVGGLGTRSQGWICRGGWETKWKKQWAVDYRRGGGANVMRWVSPGLA